MRVALVTNIPAPYRLPVYEKLASVVELCVYFCSRSEPDREWKLAERQFQQVFLHERFLTYQGRYIHINPDIWKQLRVFQPDVVITTGFNPTHLMAYFYTRWVGGRHVVMTDGTYQSEKKLSFLHHWVRRLVFAHTKAFIGASQGSLDLFRRYGVDAKSMFLSYLCANNAAFFNAGQVEKRFDFLFCGRLVHIKNPMFAVKVAQGVADRLGRKVALLLVGSGPMEQDVRNLASMVNTQVECVWAGFAQQDQLPSLYATARVFLFPTLWDPWGVVANEACAAGLPVLVTPCAGSAGELIQHGENGFVLPLDETQWVEAGVRLLSDHDLYSAMSQKARSLVSEYSFEKAAQGIHHALMNVGVPT